MHMASTRMPNWNCMVMWASVKLELGKESQAFMMYFAGFVVYFEQKAK